MSVHGLAPFLNYRKCAKQRTSAYQSSHYYRIKTKAFRESVLAHYIKRLSSLKRPEKKGIEITRVDCSRLKDIVVSMWGIPRIRGGIPVEYT